MVFNLHAFSLKTKCSVLYYARDSFEISSMANNKNSLTSVTFSVLLAPHGFHLQQLCCALNNKKALNSYLCYFLSVSDMMQATLFAYPFFIVKLVQGN
jgi:hypothetical protein